MNEPNRREISTGTTRRIRLTELGNVILIENLHFTRDGDVVSELWRVVGKVTGPNRWHEAHVELGRLNEGIAEALRENARRRAGSAGSD